MIKKGTRYLLLPLLFISMCVCAHALLFKPAKIVKAGISKHSFVAKTVNQAKKRSRAFAGSITVFTIPGELSDAVFTETTPNNYIIGIAVHASTDISKITPHVEISPGATIVPFPTDVQTDFNGSKLYTIDPAGPVTVHYNVQVIPASAVSVCADGPITLTGGTPTPPGTFKWQQLQPDNTWADAPGANQGADYYIGGLANTSGAPKIFTYRRAITFGGTTYDSYTDLTVNPVIPITGNTITQPSAANSTFCVTGNPGTIQGNDASGGDNNPQYQWQSSVGGAPFANVSGANGRDYAPGPINATTKFQRIVKAGDCTPPTTSAPVTIIILPAITNNEIYPPGTTTFCIQSVPAIINGQNPPSGGAGSGTFQYQWQSSTDGTHFTDIPGAGAQGHDYNAPALTQTTYFQRLAKSGACSTWVPSDQVVKITIQPGLSGSNITATGPTTFCGPATPATITGDPTTGGDGTPVYQWESSPDGGTYQPIIGANGKDFSPPQVTATIYYHRTVKSGSCTTPLISAPVTFTVQPVLGSNTITDPPVTSFCGSGSPGAINGSIPTGGSGIYTIVWQQSVNGGPMTDIQNSNVQNYTPATVTQTTVFQRTVTSGNCTTPLVSNQVTITIQPPLANNSINPPPTVNFCQTADSAPITGSTPTGGDGAQYNYQWQSSPTNSNFTDIQGETRSTYNPPPTNVTMFYQRVVTSGTCSTPLISNTIEIHVTQPVDPTSNKINPPLITNNCTSVDPATIIGSIPSGGDGPNSFNYQWEMSTDGGATWTPVSSGGNTADYDPPPITQSTMYHRNVTSGYCTVPVASNAVTLTIVDSPPNITISPTTPICAGDKATLSIVSPDAALTYNWYDTPTRDNLLFQGPAFKTLALTANQTFYAEASNGTCSSPQLASVDVTVNQLPDVPVLDDAEPAGCKGSPAILKVASPQNGITYKWYTGTAGGAALFTGPEFTTPVLTDDITYYVEASNASGCISATRTGAAITVYPLPVATAQGASICPGTTAILTANNPDPDQTINWYDAATGGTQVGTGSTFTTPVLNGTASYYAEAVNTVSGCISATRAEAKVQMLTPLPAPVVHVTAAAAPDLTFTWVPVDGAVAYQVSTDNGVSFTDPSTGPEGTSHTVTGLQVGQTVTILVRALGNTACETSPDSKPVMGIAAEPNVDKIFVANAFTPNGDGKNDIVYVHNDNIKTLKFSVYDQWGNMLFQSLSPQKGWDGTYKGKLQPVGVYVYYLEAVMNDGQPVTKKGTITLLR